VNILTGFTWNPWSKSRRHLFTGLGFKRVWKDTIQIGFWRQEPLTFLYRTRFQKGANKNWNLNQKRKQFMKVFFVSQYFWIKIENNNWHTIDWSWKQKPWTSVYRAEIQRV
jgi:hypothetical protein